jgi:hypothetical protein
VKEEHMRTYVHFDSEGTIGSLVAVDGPEGVAGGLVPKPGFFVDEVKGVKLTFDERGLEAAGRLVEEHKVAPAPSPRKLVKK